MSIRQFCNFFFAIYDELLYLWTLFHNSIGHSLTPMRCFTSYGRGTLTILIEYIVIQNSERKNIRIKTVLRWIRKIVWSSYKTVRIRLLMHLQKIVKCFGWSMIYIAKKTLISSEFEFILPTEKQNVETDD